LLLAACRVLFAAWCLLACWLIDLLECWLAVLLAVWLAGWLGGASMPRGGKQFGPHKGVIKCQTGSRHLSGEGSLRGGAPEDVWVRGTGAWWQLSSHSYIHGCGGLN